jgi:hypothetical protein
MKTKRNAAVLVVILAAVLMLCAINIDIDNKDRVAFFKSIEIPEGMNVNGDAVALFGSIKVDGTLTGDAVSIFGSISISGAVDGDVISVGGKVSVKGNGKINGDAVGILGGIDKTQDASIRGEIIDIGGPFNFGSKGLIPRISYGEIVGVFIIYAFSCLAILISPDRIIRMSVRSREEVPRHFAVGFVAILLFIPVSVILTVLFAITIIGIVFIPFIFIIFVLLAFIGMVALEIAIGRRITGELEGRNSIFIHLMVGVIIVFVLESVPIIGWILYLGLASVALGVVIDTKLGSPAVRKQASNV